MDGWIIVIANRLTITVACYLWRHHFNINPYLIPICINTSQGRRGHKGDKGEPGAIHLSDESSEASHVRVAFSVTMDEDVLKSTEYRVLHFNVVHTNYGDNYDPSTGVFTTPINGTYLLGASFLLYIFGLNVLIISIK